MAKFTLKPYSVAMVEVTMQATATDLFVIHPECEPHSVQQYSSTIPNSRSRSCSSAKSEKSSST
ncbi:hypothetical protein AMAG_17735 [Allomyces macrogynus ATCC 38327]|uniref:Uncharacterized protein n=1 Tax=Allomyces macrogynus (strain ATCC 38327) TaxID=578462 RepID=A0A0L0RXL2_ALLM3|nr:hypothetical protein AMAG_17735 [Allomyces macrogynus ATCC 38327]|eukprot:KNE55112.1 hypothetical protein AMAG_17735 [Allomyces macrogynus ATCC 38327]